MLSSFILSIVAFLQQVRFEYVYGVLGVYACCIWFAYGIWLWKDTRKRFTNPFVQSGIWLLAFATFIPGLFIYLLVRPVPRDDEAFWIDLEHKYLLYETRGMEECSVCGYMLRPEFLCCPACGEVVREKCLVCNNLIDISWRVCPFCRDEKWEEEEELFLQKKGVLVSLRAGVRRVYVSVLRKLVKGYYTLRAQLLSLQKAVMDRRKSMTDQVATKPVKEVKKEQKIMPKSKFVDSVKTLFVVEEKVPTKKDI